MENNKKVKCPPCKVQSEKKPCPPVDLSECPPSRGLPKKVPSLSMDDPRRCTPLPEYPSDTRLPVKICSSSDYVECTKSTPSPSVSFNGEEQFPEEEENEEQEGSSEDIGLLGYENEDEFLNLEVSDSYYEKLIQEPQDYQLLYNMFQRSKESGPNVIFDPRFNTLLNPYECSWIFGLNPHIPVLNLGSETSTIIFYTSTNVGVFHNYCTHKQELLYGHRRRIMGVSRDSARRFLCTSGCGKDSVTNIWDMKNKEVLRTLFDFAPNSLCVRNKLSPSGKLLVIAFNSDEENCIDLYDWSVGREQPDDRYKVPLEFGPPQKISYHPNKEEHMMVIYKSKVIFLCWNHDKRKFFNVRIPNIRDKNVGEFTSCTYVNRSHECFVSTTNGFILKFGSTIYTKPWTKDGPDELSNEEQYINAIKICDGPIYTMGKIEGIIFTGDYRGYILYFDSQLKLLYWFSSFHLHPICSISLRDDPSTYTEIECIDQHLPRFIDVLECNIEDRSEYYHKICKGDVPTDATVQRYPFYSRNLIVETIDDGIYLIRFVERTCTKIIRLHNDEVCAIDTHYGQPFVAVAYKHGHIEVNNYELSINISSTNIDLKEHAHADDDPNVITSMKYGTDSLHLLVGSSVGEVWFLHPILLQQRYVKFHIAQGKVEKFAFSDNFQHVAYYDSHYTVCVLSFQDGTWVSRGKVRGHYKSVCNILFDNNSNEFYTIGTDRFLLCYGIPTDIQQDVVILRRERIDQSSVPRYFISYPRGKFSKSNYFLVCDNRFKYKILNVDTCMYMNVRLGPSHGCFAGDPVTKMEFLPNTNNEYLIFKNKNYIGIQKVPIDGNPYKYISSLGHPYGVADFAMTSDGKHLITFGVEDFCYVMWNIKTIVVENLRQIGGQELEPFYCLLQGGKNGWLFKEMADMFYYMQILHQGEYSMMPRTITDYIELVELPDLVRACGYYPTDYEIELLLTDIAYQEYDDTGVLKTTINFVEFVKLFINHKPCYGYRFEDLRKAFHIITTDDQRHPVGIMRSYKFLEALTCFGETFHYKHLQRCVAALTKHSTWLKTKDIATDTEAESLPELMNFDYFTKDLLGIDLDIKDEHLGHDDDDAYVEESNEEIQKPKSKFSE